MPKAMKRKLSSCAQRPSGSGFSFRITILAGNYVQLQETDGGLERAEKAHGTVCRQPGSALPFPQQDSAQQPCTSDLSGSFRMSFFLTQTLLFGSLQVCLLPSWISSHPFISQCRNNNRIRVRKPAFQFIVTTICRHRPWFSSVKQEVSVCHL